MYDIITQIEQAAAGSVTDEIHLLKQRRKSLDHVIKFTLGINRLQHSLESISLLKKPTKDIPRDLVRLFGNISDTVGTLPSSELTTRLTHIEETLQHDIETIMGISNEPSVLDSTSGEQSASEDIAEKLQTLINDFRRRANTAIVLKLHLRTRGVNVAETTIPVKPEALLTQITKLVVEEKKCHKRTKEELNKLDKQIIEIIDNENSPEEVRQYALTMHEQIDKNIEHINKGRDIEKMPFLIEIIQIKDSEDITTKPAMVNKESSAKPTGTVKDKTEAVSNNTNHSKIGFFKKFMKWLSTPWSVKWHDIE